MSPDRFVCTSEQTQAIDRLTQTTDGLFVARILARSGYPVTVQAWGLDVAWPESGLIVDALFGIGLSRDLDAATPVVRNGAHKYENGVVHVIGGSSGMTGALVMAANAAWRAGCGAVFAHTPQGLLPRIEASLIQQVKLGYGTPNDTHFTLDHVASVRANLLAKPGIVVIGPGLGFHPATIEFIQALCTQTKTPWVIDADALAGVRDLVFTDAIFTPHSGELAKMTGRDTDRWTDRLDAARQLAASSGATVVSKGQPTAIISPNGQAKITGYSTKRFARMGYGDVLAGTIAAFSSFEQDAASAAHNALLAGYADSLTSNDPYLPS